MSPYNLRPASAATEDQGAFDARSHKPADHSARRSPKPTLTVRVLPDGEPLTVTGRVAQTLALLLKVGAAGFNSGEASFYGWARRTSDYVFRLRGLGFAVSTDLETVGDARVARYRLASRVEVVERRENAR